MQLLKRDAKGGQERYDYKAPEHGALWLRWYPDSNFAERGIAPITPEEGTALASFVATPTFRDFPALTLPDTQNAWATFVSVCGDPARALHLLRTEGKDLPKEMSVDLRNGRIAGAPARVAVFTLAEDDLTLIKTCEVPDPDAVNYSAAVADGTGWITDFDAALDLGMGTRIEEGEALEIFDKADWILAVGLSVHDSVAEIDAFLTDAIANGDFRFMRPNDATNNAGEQTTGHSTSVTQRSDMADRMFEHELQIAQKSGTAGERLARTLGLPTATLSKAPNSGQLYQSAARAMITLIGPVLLDDKLNGASQLQGIDETAFIRAIADHYFPQGQHPGIQVGTAAYGVLPVAVTNTLDTAALNTADQRTIGATTVLYDQILGGLMEKEARAVVPRLHAEDPDAAEKLDVILQSYPRGRRVDVYQDGEEIPMILDCPYVEGRGQDPKKYLGDLQDAQLARLDDVLASDPTMPLLCRLILRTIDRHLRFQIVRGAGNSGIPMDRLSHLENIGNRPLAQNAVGAINWYRDQSLRQIATSIRPFPSLPQLALRGALKRNAADLSDALRVLRDLADEDDGTARLETLMIETIDLFQYRIDAWLTGLAQMSLDAQMVAAEEKDQPLARQMGYFALLSLEDFKRQRAQQGNAKYLQAPTPAQATTAAVLHSAGTRHGSGHAFDIDLSAPRVRLGLDLLERVAAGLSIGVALGLLGERWLRRVQQAQLVLPLRTGFPIQNANTPGADTDRAKIAQVFDGLAFARSKAPKSPSTEADLHATLTDALDAFSDLVLAEAAYQRAKGAAERANAWLSVLSGGAVPERPAFISSMRAGHASDHQIGMALVPATRKQAGSALLALADPNLAAYCATLTPLKKDLAMRVEVRRVDDGSRIFREQMGGRKSPLPSPVELVFMSVDAIRRRLVHRALSTYRSRIAAVEDDPLAGLDADALLSSAMYRVHCVVDGETLSDLADWHAPLARIAGVFRRARALEPTDLTRINNFAGQVDDAALLTSSQAAFKNIKARRGQLKKRIAKIGTQIDTARIALFDDMIFDVDPYAPSVRRSIATLNTRLAEAAPLFAGGKVPMVTGADIVADRTAVEDRISDIIHQMTTRVAQARPSYPAPKSLDDTNRAIAAERELIRTLLGRPEFPVLPQYAHVQMTQPMISSVSRVESGLGEWPKVRAKVQPLLTCATYDPELRLHTGIDHGVSRSNSDDPRPETESPRKHHFARFLSRSANLGAEPHFCGVIVDEWVETRPATEQPATLAISYDAPQAEAPNTILLGVPAKLDSPAWSENSAAEIVREMIRILQIRALGSHDTLFEATILPGSNTIANAFRNGRWVDRIPVTDGKRVVRPASEISRRFVEVEETEIAGIRGSGLRETLGYGGKRGGT
ncbi:hypothetical protein [uncultured Tateyamaria sp.]|uniref:hypothetical protein n=1 Tax=Tateyamaria sp. 1078 TaxID=3417464 RepID=UPI002607B735|nr:hypothetical protein [uncultured Tateyamaria sp.]